MNFPLIQHKDFKAWIPSTDIDEIDAPVGALTEALNVDFRNGWIENSQNAEVIAHPTEIQDDITAGYELLSEKGFTHSVKGDTTVYVLYKEGSPKLVKIWLTGGGEASPLLLNIDEQSSDIEWLEKPQNINHNLVNDQFKINLNCLVKYGLSKEVIANLTLVYIDSYKAYITGSVARAEGWYLFPRWLGWYQDNITIISDTGNGTLVEDFEDTSYEAWIQTYNGSRNNVAQYRPNEGTGYYGYMTHNLDYSQTVWFILKNTITGLEKIEFDVRWGYSETFLQIELLNQDITDPSKNKVVYLSDDLASFTNHHIEIDSSQERLTTNNRLVLSFKVGPRGAAAQAYVSFDNLRITPIQERVSVVAKYDDGQRGLLASGLSLPIYNDIYLTLLKKEIDWRIDTYEIYYKVTDNLYYLYAELTPDANWVAPAAYFLKRTIGRYDQEENGVVTLPFRYGLPADTRVDNQRHIYMEVEHKGRIFFVNEDYKVYQSHISANLAIQADAFPYDEEVGFGYFITAHNRRNKGIAVTPTNYLAIFTDSGFYVYFIQPSSTGSFKTLRLSSGSIGLSSRNSITRALTGDPATDGLFWIDDNGIYFYTGDSQPPKNLILPAHEKYWRDISTDDKANMVGFYNPIKREYWLKTTDDYLITYELPYDNWKRQRFPNLGLDEFYGVFNNVLYYRSGNQFVKFNISKTNIFVIETPYNTGSVTGQMGNQRPIPEIYDKILQEVYMVFADGNSNEDVYLEVFVDGYSVETYVFNASLKMLKYLTPLGVRFNRVKFKINNSNYNRTVRIKEFGCSYTLDTKEPLGQQMVADQPSDVYGYGRSYGRAYGRT